MLHFALPWLRPYNGAKVCNPKLGLEWEEFLKQLDVIVEVVMVASNYGAYRLASKLFPDEMRILNEPTYRHLAYQRAEYGVLAKILWCLAVFGVGGEDVMELRNFLISQQKPDGGWGAPHDSDECRISVTISVFDALLQLGFPMAHGYGPQMTYPTAQRAAWIASCGIESPRYMGSTFDGIRTGTTVKLTMDEFVEKHLESVVE